MAAIYEITMLLDVALLAIVVTIFVLAVSMLGRAIEEAGRKQKEIERQKAEELESLIKKVTSKLKKTKTPSEVDKLQKDLAKYKKDVGKLEKALKQADDSYRPLTVVGCVLYPSVFTLSSFALAGGARYATTIPIGWLGHLLWGLSLIALVVVLFRVYHGLKAVQEVAITSEEAQNKKLVKALTIALSEHDQSKQPTYILQFQDMQPPFSFTKDIDVDIKYNVTLTKGTIAKGLEIWFFTPEGFAFPKEHTWKQQADYSPIPNALTATQRESELKYNQATVKTIRIKTPSESGKFKCAYRLYCEGFSGKLEYFDIEVI